MKSAFSPDWKSSKNVRKQRKYIANAPLNIKQKFIAAPLSKSLREKHKMKTMTIRKGDKVKIMRGQFKSKTGKIESVMLKKTRATVDSIFFNKKDGAKAFHPIHPSNLQITELNTDDKRRLKRSKKGEIKK
tara:strand:- start:815 stop:1207 length:393 start_codon:yes stop_codon:yes gene_type:complete